MDHCELAPLPKSEQEVGDLRTLLDAGDPGLAAFCVDSPASRCAEADASPVLWLGLLIRCCFAWRRWGGDDEEGEVFAGLRVDGHGQADAAGMDHASRGGSIQAEPGRE